MKQSEFNILVTNVTAIANQTFTIQCGEFATALSSEEENKLATEAFDQKIHIDTFDFQSIINSGYKQLDDLEDELANAWSLIDLDKLEASLKQLPEGYTELTLKLSGDQLKQWITHTLEAKDDTPFYIVHQYIMTLFQGGDDDIDDLIREAIAFDELTDLLEEENNIRAEHIKVDDLITAATIQSFKAFKFLVQHTELNNEEVIEVLESTFDDKSTFEQVYTIMAPTETQHSEVLTLAKNSNASVIIEFLTQLKSA